jgi:hypothetical protein
VFNEADGSTILSEFQSMEVEIISVLNAFINTKPGFDRLQAIPLVLNVLLSLETGTMVRF